MIEIELDKEQIETVSDVLENAEDRAVTDRERGRIREVRREIVRQWSDS